MAIETYKIVSKSSSDLFLIILK